MSLSYDACSDSCCSNTSGMCSYKKIDWLGGEKNGDLAAFSAEITSRLEPCIVECMKMPSPSVVR